MGVDLLLDDLQELLLLLGRSSISPLLWEGFEFALHRLEEYFLFMGRISPLL